MLKKRIIPTLLWDGTFCVKPRHFDQMNRRKIGPMLQQVRVMNNRNIDELVIIDIDRTTKGEVPFFSKIAEFAKELFCPLTIGGGIQTLDDIEKMLKYGADKVLIGSKSFDYHFIEEAAKRFGSQAIVCAVDTKRQYLSESANRSSAVRHVVYKQNGVQCSNLLAETHTRDLTYAGAGEIIITSIEKDGTRAGYDLSLIKTVCDTVKIPVIASGGCEGFGDMARAFDRGAAGVAASSMFLFTGLTPNDCATWLEARGYPVRLENNASYTKTTV